MKQLNQYIIEASTSSFINKIKNEFQNEFNDKVLLVSHKVSHEQLYIIHVYDNTIDTLKKVNEILKKHITVWKGYTDKELEDKLNEYNKDLKETGDKYPWKDMPLEFFRFSSKDIKKYL